MWLISRASRRDAAGSSKHGSSIWARRYGDDQSESTRRECYGGGNTGSSLAGAHAAGLTLNLTWFKALFHGTTH
ncbi:hypothetical protein HZ326_30094 [Fusarium oxysporum f. sp. albedinis]|nr:hypothetical protein HZ326_30094 [Fusarium oxysporum f. sp. albedinis]